MSDIVERLRAGCQFAEDSDMDPESFMCHRIECEAADEIEELRAKIERLREERDQREALWSKCALETKAVYGGVFVPMPLPAPPEEGK